MAWFDLRHVGRQCGELRWAVCVFSLFVTRPGRKKVRSWDVATEPYFLFTRTSIVPYNYP